LETYTSNAHKKYAEYKKWADKHPIKNLENMTGIKFTLYQKVLILIEYWKSRKKERAFNNLLKRYIK
jgi:hypothetical protein